MKHIIIPFLAVLLLCTLANAQPVRYSSDSKTDLQSVVDQLDDGGALIVEAGTYQLEKPIDIRKNVTIVGSPDADTIIQGRNGCFVVKAPKQDDKQVTLAHLTLAVKSGKKPKNFDEATIHSVMVTLGNVKLIQCQLTSDGGNGLRATGAKTKVEIVRSEVSKCAWNGVAYRERASGLIDECAIFEMTGASVFVDGSGDVSVRNSKIHSSRNNGILYEGKGTSGVIEECEIYETTTPCVAIAGGANVTISKSTIHSGKDTAGVYCAGEDTRATIKSCIIKDNGRNGINILSSNVTIEDCLLTGNGDHQLEFSKGAKLTVRKSNFNEGKKYGVNAGAQAGEATFVECHFGMNDKSGLVLVECGVTTPKFTFEKCTIYGNKLNQVVIGGGVDVTMSDSSILSGGGDFHGVLIVGATTKALFERCSFNSHKHADISIEEADPVFRNCKIHRGLGDGNGIQVDGGKGLFENCEIYDYGFPAIGITNGGNPTFKNCTIRNNNVGVYVIDKGRGTFEGNRFSHNNTNWQIKPTAGQVTRRNNLPNR